LDPGGDRLGETVWDTPAPWTTSRPSTPSTSFLFAGDAIHKQVGDLKRRRGAPRLALLPSYWRRKPNLLLLD